jgi:hypothetical protein
MIKFVLKLFNLNSKSLQIRSKQRTTSASTKQQGTSFELPEFQFGTLKSTHNSSMHQPQVNIVYHDHFAVITWFDTHIIVHGSKRINFRKKNFLTQDSTFCSHEKPCKAFSSSATLKERLSKDRSSLTSEWESGMLLGDLPMRQRPVKLPCLRLTFSSSSELEESSLEKSKSLRVAHTHDMIF